MKCKRLITFSLFFICILYCKTSFSQYTPLYNKFFAEQIRGINQLDSEIVILQMTAEYPDFGSSLTPSDVQGSFSNLFKYDFNGDFIEKLSFPDNDSIYHYATFMRKTNNGQLIVAGDYWYITMESAYNPFIAVINSEFEFDSIYYFNHTIFDVYTEQLILSESAINHFTLPIKRNFNFSLELINQPINMSSCFGNTGSLLNSSIFYFNNKIYRLFFDPLFSNTKTTLMDLGDNQNNCTNVYEESSTSLLEYSINEERPVFASSGARITDDAYLIHGVTNQQNPILLKVDSSESVSLLLYDTTNNYESLDFAFSSIDFVNSSHIYFAYSATQNNEQGILLYCFNNEALRWKKFFPLDDGLEFGNFIPLNQIIATPKNDCIVTITTKGFQDASDVYVLRVDSNGNSKDFVTSINHLENNQKNLFSVYPNPAKDMLNYSSNYNEDLVIHIFNNIGQTLKRIELNFNTNKVDISNFSKGVYFYQFKTKQGEILHNGKFIKT